MDRPDKDRSLRTWRSLDQPSAFFGIKGRFMTLFILIAAAAAIVAIVIGSSYGSMIGMLIIGGLLFCDYLFVLSIQAKMTDKEFSRMISSRSLPKFIRVTPESVQSHLKRAISWK
jgi:hypothetical protein